jgi:hypothetical protein
MGLFVRRRVINVYDIPLDILVETMGRGLTINRQDEEYPKFEASIGKGLYFDEEGKVNVYAGLGLQIDCFNRVSCDLGDGLHHTHDGKIHVKTGNGLTVSESGVSVDNVVDPCQTVEFVVQVDSQLSIDAQKLSLKKFYRKHTVLKNAAGLVLDIVQGEVFDCTGEVILAVPYGYGCGGPSYRTATPEAPAFYKQ